MVLVLNILILISIALFLTFLKLKDIYSVLLHFFILISILITALLIYFSIFLRYNEVVNTIFILEIFNFLIPMIFLFNKKSTNKNNRIEE